jgi:hypothetical protein
MAVVATALVVHLKRYAVKSEYISELSLVISHLEGLLTRFAPADKRWPFKPGKEFDVVELRKVHMRLGVLTAKLEKANE